MKYTKLNWKYRLNESYLCKTKKFDFLDYLIHKRHYVICKDYVLAVKNYAWDGPSGPTIDTKNSMRAALIHDILYQAIREKELPKKCRAKADKLFLELLKEDGMFCIRRWIWYLSVRAFGASRVK